MLLLSHSNRFELAVVVVVAVVIVVAVVVVVVLNIQTNLIEFIQTDLNHDIRQSLHTFSNNQQTTTTNMPPTTTTTIVSDAEFIQLQQVRPRHAKAMHTLMKRIQSAALKAQRLQRRMDYEASQILVVRGPVINKPPIKVASFEPFGTLAEQYTVLKAKEYPNPSELVPDFSSIVRTAERVIAIADSALVNKDSTIIVPKAKQTDFARRKYKITIPEAVLEAGWHPATHYHSGDFRPVTPTYSPREDFHTRERKAHFTPAGSWILSCNGLSDGGSIAPPDAYEELFTSSSSSSSSGSEVDSD